MSKDGDAVKRPSEKHSVKSKAGAEIPVPETAYNLFGQLRTSRSVLTNDEQADWAAQLVVAFRQSTLLQPISVNTAQLFRNIRALFDREHISPSLQQYFR
jgi:hypothetical protein